MLKGSFLGGREARRRAREQSDAPIYAQREPKLEAMAWPLGFCPSHEGESLLRFPHKNTFNYQGM